jgi:hypothetical protein
LCIPLEIDDDDIDRNKMERLLDCVGLMKSCVLLPHTPLWESFFFDTSSCIHDHHMGGKLQAYDLLEIAYLEFAHHFSFLPYVDVFKIHMIAHSMFFFET